MSREKLEERLTRILQLGFRISSDSFDFKGSPQDEFATLRWGFWEELPVLLFDGLKHNFNIEELEYEEEECKVRYSYKITPKSSDI